MAVSGRGTFAILWPTSRLRKNSLDIGRLWIFGKGSAGRSNGTGRAKPLQANDYGLVWIAVTEGTLPDGGACKV